MNQNFYTFIGSCHAVEHALANDPEVAAPVATLASIRTALLESSSAGDPDANLKSALESHVVSLLEAVELLRTNPKYQALDGTLIELMNNYYNISDAIMGGGGGGSGSGGGSGAGTEDDG